MRILPIDLKSGLNLKSTFHGKIFRYKSDAISIIALLIVNIFVLSPSIFGKRLFSLSWDGQFYIAPVFSSLSRIFESGDFPLRIPNFFYGFPTYNWTEFSAYYPFYFLKILHFDGFHKSVELLHYITIFHIFLASVTTYIMLRVIGFAPAVSLVSAVCFSLSADMYSYSLWVNIVAPYSWLPLLLAFYFLIMKYPNKLRWQIGFGLTLAFMISASPSQPVIHSFFLIFILFIVQSTLKENIRNISVLKKRFTSLASGGGLGITITLPILIPAISDFPQMIRWTGDYEPTVGFQKMSFDAYTHYRLPFGDLSQIFANKTLDLVGSSYIGIIVAALILISLKRKMAWAQKSFFFIGIYSLFSSMGDQLGFAYINYRIPGISMIREPSRFLVLFHLSCAVLVAFAVSELIAIKTISKARRIYIITIISTLAVTNLILGFHDSLSKPEEFLNFMFLGYLLFKFLRRNFQQIYVTPVLVCSLLLSTFIGVNWTPPYSYSDSDYVVNDFAHLENIYEFIARDDPTNEYRVAFSDDVQKSLASMTTNFKNIRGINYWVNPAPLNQAIDVDFNPAKYGKWTHLRSKFYQNMGAKYFICKSCAKQDLPTSYNFQYESGPYSLFSTFSAKPEFTVSSDFQKYSSFDDLMQKIGKNPMAIYTSAELVLTPTVKGRSQTCKPRVISNRANGFQIDFGKCQLRGEILSINEYRDGNWRATSNGKEVPLFTTNGNQIGMQLFGRVRNLTILYSPNSFAFAVKLTYVGCLMYLFYYFIFITSRNYGRRVQKNSDND